MEKGGISVILLCFQGFFGFSLVENLYPKTHTICNFLEVYFSVFPHFFLYNRKRKKGDANPPFYRVI
jgi:hypothetical protein